MKFEKNEISRWSAMLNTELVGLTLVETQWVIGSIVYLKIGESIRYLNRKGVELYASEWKIGLRGYRWEVIANGNSQITSGTDTVEMEKYLGTLRAKTIVRFHISKQGMLRLKLSDNIEIISVPSGEPDDDTTWTLSRWKNWIFSHKQGENFGLEIIENDGISNELKQFVDNYRLGEVKAATKRNLLKEPVKIFPEKK